jgi:predicted nucleic acid-binding protein
MTTAIDSNIFIALWDDEDVRNPAVRPALDLALGRGSLVVAAPVYGELLAFPERSEAFLDRFFGETGVSVDWNLNEAVWRTAGLAYKAYAARRRKLRDPGPRRLLVDFLIGAHALRNGFPLLTLDDRIFRAAFPRLSVVNIQN